MSCSSLSRIGHKPLQRQIEAKDVVARVFLLRQHAKAVGLAEIGRADGDVAG